jgi:transposase-like protein/IS1 family transposase
MTLTALHCPTCNSTEHKFHTFYTVGNGEQREVRLCQACGTYFSETKNTPLARLRRPLSFITLVLNALNDGMSLNAAGRTFGTTRKSIKRWLVRLGGLKETLLLYALCHQFLKQLVEGDELYTKVDKNKPPAESEGWTIVLMERASRFIWELSCGTRETELFKRAMATLAQVIAQTAELSLVTDGERRYGNLLFEICQEVVRTGQVGRSPITLKKGVKVRVKNKGSQAHRTGPKRPKYQAPHREHPETQQNLDNEDVHANHVEGFNSAARRKISCYRRKTNTYAKDKKPLQKRLDAYWVLHNFVRPHFTTKQVPAVALGILEKGFSVAQLFRIQRIARLST